MNIQNLITSTQTIDESVTKVFSDVSVIIPAAGHGKRLGLGPKALLELDGFPILTWLSRKVLKFCNDVIVAVPSDTGNDVQSLCPGCRCIEGGDTRQESVKRLVGASGRDWIVVADVTRPFTSSDLFFSVLQKAREVGAAGAFLNPDVPAAHIVKNCVVHAFQHHEIGIFQSPQAFSRVLLEKIYATATVQNLVEQSTVQLALRTGEIVGTVPGEKINIKLTTAEDWQLAKFYKEYLR